MRFQAEAKDAGKRLDRWLHERLPAYSRSRIQQWIRAGAVRVEGGVAKPSLALRGGETVDVEPVEPPPLRATPEAIPLEILYEDADLVAVNKPAGMVAHAGAGCRQGTLVNALLHRFGALSAMGGELRPGIVHRLDRYTSGVILAARHDVAHRRLAEQFAGRQVEKVYLALVHGAIREEAGTIERPIARDPVRRERMSSRLGRGRPALTEYRVLRRFKDYTYLEVRIRTGRTHQIRVHLAGSGHPVAGDRLYGAPAKGGAPATRFFLHARRIRFRHPMTGEPLTIEAPLPAELEAWLARLI